MGHKVPNTVLHRLSILKQQESDIKEVIVTIKENIDQQREDLRFCLPELREVLIGLLEELSIDTQDLTSRLGEGHPVSILCEQREDQLTDTANETIYMSDIILRQEEEWFRYGLSYVDEAGASNSANAEAATNVHASSGKQDTRQAMTVSELDTKQPLAITVSELDTRRPMMELSTLAVQAETKNTLQVTESSLETIDTAVCLPLGPASTAQPTTDIRPPLPPSLLLQHEDKGELGYEEEEVRG